MSKFPANPERISNIEKYINNYNGEGIIFYEDEKVQ